VKSLAAVCRSPWSAPDELEGTMSKELLARLVMALGGTITPGREASTYEVEVPIANWRSLRDALTSPEAQARGGSLAPPSGADCVRVGIRLVP
jgi:hypothetical protein